MSTLICFVCLSRKRRSCFLHWGIVKTLTYGLLHVTFLTCGICTMKPILQMRKVRFRNVKSEN